MDELKSEHWMERFAEWMRLRNWTQGTIETYRVGVVQFFDYLRSQGVQSLTEMSRELIEGFRSHLYYRRHRGKNLAVSTQTTRLLAAKAFVKFLVRENLLLVDWSASVDLPKSPEKLPKVLAEEDVIRLLEAPDVSTLKGIRDRAILETFYATALRNGELRRLCLEDIDREHSALWVHLGKGQKSRMVPIGEEALAWLEEYLRRVRPQYVSRDGQQVVFLSSNGLPLRRPCIVRILARYAAQVQLPGVTAHTLRHSCATHMLRRGAELRHLQEMLGHNSPVTTQHYTQVDLTDLHKVVRRCHPRERKWFS